MILTGKMFFTNGVKIYSAKGDEWLVNEVDAQEIVDKMNSLYETKMQRSKALSKRDLAYNKVSIERAHYKKLYEEHRKYKDCLIRQAVTIREAYLRERTDMGRNTLKQLMIDLNIRTSDLE